MGQIQNILYAQSAWTWDIMQSSTQIGEMIREDAITSVNLTVINSQASQIGLTILSNQGAHLERETGADWMWMAGNYRWLVQAKRLDIVQKVPKYLIDLEQMSGLLQYAVTLNNSKAYGDEQFVAAYVFYNSMIERLAHNKAVVGCIAVKTDVLQNYIIENRKPRRDQKDITLAFDEVNYVAQGRSWAEMFPGL